VDIDIGINSTDQHSLHKNTTNDTGAVDSTVIW
jgi:hypothetical protein